MRWRTPLVALLVLGGLPLACGGGDGGPTSNEPSAEAEERFGTTPHHDADVAFQPDVVFLDDGAAAIRSVTSDGTTWTIDGSADGVDEIEPGSVLYATSLAVGRVVAVERDGDDLVVALAPVDLGEVIANGELHFSGPLDLEGAVIRAMPDLPGAVSDLDAESLTSTMRTTTGEAGDLRYVNVAHHSPFALTWPTLPPMPPPFTQGAAEFSAGKFAGSVTRDSGDVRFHVEHTGDDLKGSVDVTFGFVSPSLDADVGIIDGDVGDAALELRGLREIGVAMDVGSVSGLASNTNQKIEVPIRIDRPVIIGGVALNLGITFKLLVQTAFTAKNSTLSAVGVWTTDGPLAYDRTSGKVSVIAPTITPKVDILESMKGISIGVNGYVFAIDMRLMLGLGIPAANTGPYARLTTSLGLSMGSDIGFAGQALKCKQATVTFTGSFGVGLALSTPLAAGLNAYFRRLGSATPVKGDNLKELVSEPLYSKSFWSPDTDYCRLDG